MLVFAVNQSINQSVNQKRIRVIRLECFVDQLSSCSLNVWCVGRLQADLLRINLVLISMIFQRGEVHVFCTTWYRICSKTVIFLPRCLTSACCCFGHWAVKGLITSAWGRTVCVNRVFVFYTWCGHWSVNIGSARCCSFLISTDAEYIYSLSVSLHCSKLSAVTLQLKQLDMAACQRAPAVVMSPVS